MKEIYHLLNQLILFFFISIPVFTAGCGKKEEKTLNSFQERKEDEISRESHGKPAESEPEPSAVSVHVFAALADNASQGIVPVPQTLGNGNDPHNNLYWGAMYGIRTFFGRKKEWKLVSVETGISETVLERCVFRYTANEVILISDAYRGSEIKKTLKDFMNALAGKNPEHIDIKGTKAGIHGAADLAVYAGHNVLMDFTIRATGMKPEKQGIPGIVLACKSKQYFLPWFRKFNSKPVLLTTGLMAPEAYVLEAALTAWINGGLVKEKSAQAYNRYQNCGIHAAQNLFYSE